MLNCLVAAAAAIDVVSECQPRPVHTESDHVVGAHLSLAPLIPLPDRIKALGSVNSAQSAIVLSSRLGSLS